MHEKLRKILITSFFPLLIILLAGFLSWQNFTPGTILSGWDTIHPEFNFPLAFNRVFSGAWREEQGVGTVAAHAHMADLPRVALLWTSSLIFPVESLRYLYFFLTLAIGPIGVYFFIKNVLGGRVFSTKLAAFLGGSFYLLNLNTLQHFYVPFEMFATQFAFLPWLFLFTFKFIRKGRRKDLIVFGGLSIVATPMAFASAFFYVYLTGLGLFLFTHTLLSKEKWALFKKTLIIAFTVLVTNAFWLLPNLYSISNQGDTISQARINQNFSPEAFLSNKDYGTAKNVLLNKNFLFSWREYDTQNSRFVNLLDEWSEHLEKPLVQPLGYLFAAIYLAGIVISLLKRNRVAFSLLPVLLFSLFFLFNENFLFGGLYEHLRDNYSLFKEAFRMPFTKFSILFTFTISFYLSFVLNWLFGVLGKLRLSLTAILLSVLFFTSLIVYMLPAFSGNLVSSSMRVEIPKEYSTLFAWFEKNSNGRVAKLPLNTHMGWNYYDWGYEGAGFISFGIPNPLLDRDFDRWSSFNEGFFNEASLALNSGDAKSFETVLEKYQVKYLLVDESIIHPGGNNRIEITKEVISKSDNITLVETFGFLSVYETKFGQDDFITAPNDYFAASGNLTYASLDPLYSRFGDYAEVEGGAIYPFVNFDTRAPIEITMQGQNLVLANQGNLTNVKISAGDNIVEDLTLVRGFKEPHNCDTLKNGEVDTLRSGGQISYSATGGGVNCDFFVYPDLDYSQGYLAHITGKNREGRSLKVYIFNNSNNWGEVEELLPEGRFDVYLPILPKNIQTENERTGYTLNLETRSIGRIASQNIVETIEIIPLPYKELSALRLGFPNYITNSVDIKAVEKYGTAFYKADVHSGSENGIIVLSQGYEDGWLAFSEGKRLEHIKVNSWANGWVVPEGSHTIAIFYWPQILQYLGMGVLILLIPVLIKKA